MKLSQHFSLAEFTRSQTAKRMGRTVVADPAIIDNLTQLCEHVLEPVRMQLNFNFGGGVRIHPTSGYRPAWLNKAIGGSKTSDHVNGRAADFVLSGGIDLDLFAACHCIADSNIPFDQLIHEGGEWIHISFRDAEHPRREVKTATFSRGLFGRRKTTYHPGLITVDALAA